MLGLKHAPGKAPSVSAISSAKGKGGGGAVAGRWGRRELKAQKGRRLVREGHVALNTADNRGVVAGGCITYSALLKLAILTLILHTLILPTTNLDTFICVHFNGMPGSSALTVA